MHTIIVKWEDDCSGSVFTLHSVSMLYEYEIYSSIDALGEPEGTEHCVLPDYAVPELTDEELEAYESDGFLDCESLSKELEGLWKKHNRNPVAADVKPAKKPEPTINDSVDERLRALKKKNDDLLIRVAMLDARELTREEARYLTGRTNQNTGVDYVYLMKDKVNNLYKIGKSKNPKRREKTLQSEKPSISMVFSVEFREDFNEKVLHGRYAAQRVRGEWFDLSPAQVRYITKVGNSA